jgi:hypothetical protein
MSVKNMSAQSPCIGVTDMINPALYAGIQFRKRDFARLIQVDIVFQTHPARRRDAQSRVRRIAHDSYQPLTRLASNPFPPLARRRDALQRVRCITHAVNSARRRHASCPPSLVHNPSASL